MRNGHTLILRLAPITVSVRGAVVADEATYAENAVADTITDVDRPVGGLRVRITRYAGRGDPPFAVAQVNVNVGARLVRAQAAAPAVAACRGRGPAAQRGSGASVERGRVALIGGGVR